MAPICSYYFTLSTFVLSLALLSGSESKSDSSLLPQFEQHPVNQTKELRESAIFKCRTRKVENVPKATIIWFKNDRKVTGFEATQHYIITSEGDLVIQGVRGDLDPLKSDEGEYFCRAENSHGSTESTHAFLVIYSMGETFKVSPQNSSVQIGQSTLLQCEPPESHPRSKVTWLKDGVYIDTKNDDHFSLVGHNLAVQKAEGIHSGQYVCVATNGHHKKLSKPATLHVGTQPFFTKQLKQHYSAAEGESIILECRASGTPPPEIFWTKADFIRIDENSPKYIVKRGSLQIMNLAQSDGGSYACIASNDIQSIKSQTTVLVAGERPGFLKTPPSQTTVPKGDDVTLPCQPRDFNTEVFWSLPQNHKTSALVKGQSTGRISVTDLGSLVIKQAKVEDSGQYRCSILALEGGDNSVTVDVTVKQPIVDPPPLIDIEPYNQSVGVGADVLLPCYAEGSSSLPTIHWTFNSRPLSGNDRHLLLINGSLHVINTKPEDSGIYTCTAYNVFGETSTNANLKVTSSKSGQSEHAISVDYLPPPPNFFSVSKIGLTDVELMWFPAYFQDPQISISYRVDFYSDGLGKWKSSWTDFRADRKPNEPVYFKLEGLSLSSRHLFTVRSCNYIGCGRTVQLHYKVQLLGSSALDMHMHSVEEKSDKFEVELFEPTVINSTFAVLSWRVISNPASVMNFAIDVDDEFSPAWHTDSKPVLTKFLDRNQRNFAIANLKAASKYNITITTKLNTGVLITRRQSVQTLQAPPSAAPDHVTAMLNGTKIQISWMPPQADYVNGILTGYVILVYNEKGLSLYNISTGNVTHSLIELESNRHHKVIIRVAARSMAPGIGVESDPITLTFGKPPGSFTWDESYTWILAVLGVFVWVMLIVLAFVITKRWFNNYKQSPPIKYRKTPMKQLYHESDVSNLTVESEMFISAPVGDQIEFMSKDPIPSWLRGNQHQVNSRVFTPFYSSATLKQAAATAGATPFTVSSTTPSTLKVYKQSVLTESSTSQEPQLIIPSQNYNIPSQILHPLCEFSDSNPFLNCHQNTTGTRSSRLLQLPARPCQTQSGLVPASDPSHDKSFTSLVHKTSSSRSSNNSPSLPDESCKYCQGAVSDKHQPAGFPDASGIHIGKPDQDSSFVTTSHYASVDPVFYCDNYTALELCVNGSN